MKKFFLLFLLPVLISAFFPNPCPAQNYQNAVVKVFVTSNRIDFSQPWQTTGSQATSGSGCVIEGNRILTNAHVVADHTFIQVRKESSPKKYTARALAVAHDCDLALLTVDDPEFFKDITPLAFGELPQLRDEVTVIGFPMGGDKLSITEGVVSRIEVIPYAQSANQLLGIQIDAAINPGNSGGPVLKDGKLAGIAMQMISDSQNIGYMIPIPVVDHFLKDIGDNDYAGFPFLGIEYNTTENPALRQYYGLSKDDGGVVIAHVLPFTPADGVLKIDDILLAIDAVPIAQDATFLFRGNERLSFSYLVHSKQVGDRSKIKVLRDGKMQTLDIVFSPFQHLVPPPHQIPKPSYYIYGGFVFTTLSTDLLGSWGDKWWQKAPFDFLYFLVGNGRLNIEGRKEIVVLLDVLPDDINVGYAGSRNAVVVKVNDQEFKSFQEFVMLVEKAEGPYLIFSTYAGDRIIIARENIKQITENILRRNNISRPYSENVAKWLEI